VPEGRGRGEEAVGLFAKRDLLLLPKETQIGCGGRRWRGEEVAFRVKKEKIKWLRRDRETKNHVRAALV
jgi:hypothetical protein